METCKKIIRKLKTFDFYEWFITKKVWRHLLMFCAVQFAVGILWGFVKPWFGANLVLTPTVERHGTRVPLYIMLLLPLSVLLEEFIIRVVPDEVIAKLGERWNLFFNKPVLFLLVAMVWGGFLHQTNVVLANPAGQLGYFAVQCVGSFYLAWIYYYKGLLASWFVHYIFDFVIVLMVLIL